MLRARDTFIYSLSNNDKRATINVVITNPKDIQEKKRTIRKRTTVSSENTRHKDIFKK